MSAEQIKIIGVEIRRPGPATKAAGGVRAWLDLSVEVENPNTQPLHVWATYKAYDYDASTHLLSVQLAEVPLNLPPNIKLISDHISAPPVLLVAANSRVKLRVRIPGFIRRAVPKDEPGGGWKEVPIGAIDRVAVAVQYCADPIKGRLPGESSGEFRKRLLAHGDVVRAELTPTITINTP